MSVTKNIKGKTKVDWLKTSVLQKIVHFYFHFSFIFFILGGKHVCFHSKSRYKQGKVLLQKTISKAEVPTLAGNQYLFIHFLDRKTSRFCLSKVNGRT